MFQFFSHLIKGRSSFSHISAKGRSSFSTRKVDTPALPKPAADIINQQISDSRQQTADSAQTAGSRQQTADSRHHIAGRH
jgi:hypothetical protein